MSKSPVPSGLLATVVFVLACRASAAPGAVQPKVEKLWPDDTPGIRGIQEKDKPSLTICLPPADKAVGSAVVVCPGGGYGHLAVGHEGHEITAWLNSFGVAGFIVKYRHRGNGFGHPAPLQDAQRAVAVVRSRAADFGIRPDRIGIMGFSAGGHLASSVGTHFHTGDPNAADPLARVSVRPDFMILVYPVISFTEPFSHRGSMRNLLGKDPDPKLVSLFSNEKQVTKNTPPTFLIHGGPDRVVPPQNSIAFYLALKKAGVPAELHIYEQGGHGFGLGPGRTVPATAAWPKACQAWMAGRGLLTKPKP